MNSKALAAVCGAAVLAVSFSPAEAKQEFKAFGQYKNAVYVDNVTDFVKSLKNDAVIVLKPGTYNLSKWLKNEGNKKYYSSVQGISRDHVHDGFQLNLNDIDNLTIVSADPKDPAHIVVEPRYAQVMYFYGCDNLELNNVVMGHTPDQGYCSGNVVYLEKCSKVNISKADLYGCGAYGLEVRDCTDVKIDSSTIHDCTYGCAVISGTQDMKFTNTAFKDCKEFTMFELTNSNVNFERCSFKNLQGGFVSTFNSKAYFTKCSFDKAISDWMKSEGAESSIIVK